jgi:hypothetical protein
MLQTVFLDDFGSNDNERITAMNAWHLARTGPTPPVVLDYRRYDISTPITLYTGMKLRSVYGEAAREYGRGTVLNWQGAPGTSMFVFPPTGQKQPGGQSYPNPYSPKDISITGIQMSGDSDRYCLPYNTTPASEKVIWFTNFHNCAWVGFKSIWVGFQDGCTISGETYVQGFSGIAFDFNGADCRFFSGQTFISSEIDAFIKSGNPMVRCNLSQSRIGTLFATPYETSYPLLIDGGWNTVIDGVLFDAQDSRPIYGSALRIKGGKSIVVTNCSFKGFMSNPAAASGGIANNGGWIHVSGGENIIFSNNMFARDEGNIQALETIPVLYVGPNVTKKNTVKWNMNAYKGWTASPKIQNAKAGVLQKHDAEAIITTL